MPEAQTPVRIPRGVPEEQPREIVGFPRWFARAVWIGLVILAAVAVLLGLLWWEARARRLAWEHEDVTRRGMEQLDEPARKR